MGQCVIKPVREVNEYVVWSSNTDAPLFVGDQGDLIAWLRFEYRDRSPEWIREHIARADEHGSTDGLGLYCWTRNTEEDRWATYDNRGEVRCADMGTLTRAAWAGDWETVIGLLEPFEDGHDHRRAVGPEHCAECAREDSESEQ